MRDRARAFQAPIADGDAFGASISDRARQPAQHSRRRRDEPRPQRVEMIDMLVEVRTIAFGKGATGVEAFAREPSGALGRQRPVASPVIFDQLQIPEIGLRPGVRIAPRRRRLMAPVCEQWLGRRHADELRAGNRQPQEQVDVFDQPQPLVESADAFQPRASEQLASRRDEVVVFELIGNRIRADARIAEPPGRLPDVASLNRSVHGE